MRLLLASLTAGILVTATLFITVVFLRALFKDAFSVTVAMWVFFWPICFLRLLPMVSDSSQLWLSLAIGVFLDIAFFSFVTYGVLRGILSAQKRTRTYVPPPQPPTF